MGALNPSNPNQPAPAGTTTNHSISREQLSFVLDRIAEGVTVQDCQGRLVYANDIAAQWLGFENRTALLNTPLTKVTDKFQIFGEDDQPFPLEQLPGRRVIEGEGEASAILRFRILATGAERWSMVRASPIYDAHNQIEYAVNIFQDVTDFKTGEQNLRFLAEISDMLAQSMDYETVLANIANLAVKSLADWCAIHLVEENGEIVQLAVAHKDPAMVKIVLELQENYPPDPTASRGVYKALHTGEEQYFPEISDDGLKALARDPAHYEKMRSLGLYSAIVLPFEARGHILGAVTLVWSESQHRYGQREIVLGKEFARRAAQAIDNVRLYQESHKLNAKLENQVNKRTAQLEQIIDRLRTEIVERQKVEKDLQRNEALFSDLFELSPDAIFLVNWGGRIVRANAQAAVMFGFDPAEIHNQPIDLLLPERFRSNHVGHRKKYQEMPQRRAMGADLELYGRRKNGDEFPVDVMLSPIQIEDEWLNISVVRDITDQKRTQVELSEVQHQLMDTFEKERLIIAQELHDDAIQELFSISYELAEIQNDLAPNEDEKVAQKLRDAHQMAQHVIQGLRNLSRELRPPALAPFGLEHAILGHLEQFHELHPDIEIHTELTPDSQFLDEKLRLALYRIYQNAVSNIARHAYAKNLWVRLALKGQQVTLEIKDDGIGFDLPKRWVEFARKGHLGLVGTRERVEAIGGKLIIATKPGKGTRIQVIVPFLKVA